MNQIVKGKVIYLNGVNGSGKSSVAKALQNSLAENFLHVEFDRFIAMLPPRKDMNVFSQMANGFLHAMVAMLEQGCNLIIDHVLIQESWLYDSVKMLHPYEVMFVKLYCPIHILESREKSRYGTVKGIAASQFKAVNRDIPYDLELDSSLQSVEELCKAMKVRFEQGDFLAFSVLGNKI
jgi:chloramphenicol 3-O phosphotransferase